ncbi:OmpA family protein [Bacteroidota bacterium]
MAENKFKITVFLLLIIFVFKAESEENYCKDRLPKIINNFAPTIVPVITLDGKYLYFDRKGHPENTGSIWDIDEIWFSEKIDGKYWSEPQRLQMPYNTNGSDVLFSISPDGRKALIYGKYSDTNSNVKIPGYSIAYRKDNIFQDIVPLEINNYYNNSKNYYAHLSSDGKTLLFSLIRADIIGGEDIYVSFLDDASNIWTSPVNLGKAVNSESDDISPYLAYDGRTLYFSSNRRNSYGDFDLFMTRRLDNSWSKWSKPLNLGSTINSVFKESGFSLTALSDTAYIVSSEYQVIPSNDEIKLYDSIDMRHGIYRVCIPEKYRPLPYSIIQGKIFRFIGNKKIAFKKPVEFSIKFDNNFYQDFVYTADISIGKYIFVIPSDVEAKIHATADSFEPVEFKISTKTLDKPDFTTRDIILNRTGNKREGLVNPVPFVTIYFQVDDFKLTNDNEEKLYNALINIDNMTNKYFLITGHADESGTEEYNYNLSKSRSVSARDYLRKLGIPNENIVVDAKGELNPVSIDPGLNRRVEIYLSD